MKKSTRNILIGTGITAAVLALAESARQGAADYMVRVALDRTAPPHPASAERRLIAGCTDQTMLLRLKEDGRHLAAQSHEVIRLLSHDGTTLVGHWFAVEQPRRVIIAMHGWRSAWDHDFGIVADFFQKNHCSVLYAEQRAHGGSGGEYMGFGLTERYDCLDWCNWVNRRTKLPIYLCGVSMGASTVLMASSLPLPENVRGILADCGYTSPVEIWRHVAKQAHMAYDMYNGPVGRLAKRRLHMAVDTVTCPQALAEAKVPVLFVHGSDDRFVPIEMTYANFKACTSPKRLFVVPGAEHGMSYLSDPKGYENAVKSFWAEFDPPSPGKM